MVVSFLAVALSVTAGWENICAERTEFPATEAVWRADFGKKEDFSWELRDGAEATVAVDQDGIHIVKTNGKGYVIVMAKPFPVKKGAGVRFTADQTSTSADVDYSSGFLRYYGRKEKLDLSPAESKNFYRGGMQTMRGMPCTAPGMSYRKYAQCYAEDDILTPVIVVAGAASDSVWRNWFAEDLEAAQALWRKKYQSIPLPDRSSERMDEAAFDRMIAADVEHTAEVRRIDGVSRLVVDGKVVAPVAYHSRHGEAVPKSGEMENSCGHREAVPKSGEMENFGGHRLDGSAVKLMIKQLRLIYYCDPDGSNMNISGMVTQVKHAMRIAPSSLFVLCISTLTPRDFVQKRYPAEAWINAKGEPVMGLGNSCILGYMGSTKKQFDRYACQWPSPSSRVMREWAKKAIRELVLELKAQGLAKRIVGIHTCGFHDVQFSIPYTDFSKPAQEEYRRMIAEPD